MRRQLEDLELAGLTVSQIQALADALQTAWKIGRMGRRRTDRPRSRGTVMQLKQQGFAHLHVAVLDAIEQLQELFGACPAFMLMLSMKAEGQIKAKFVAPLAHLTEEEDPSTVVSRIAQSALDQDLQGLPIHVDAVAHVSACEMVTGAGEQHSSVEQALCISLYVEEGVYAATVPITISDGQRHIPDSPPSFTFSGALDSAPCRLIH